MSKRWAVFAVVMAAAIGAAVWAQDANQGAPGSGGERAQRGDGRGDRGGRGNWDPEEMRRRMMDNLKEQLKATDDEWKVLEPKVTKVGESLRNFRGGFGMGMGGRRGGGPGGGGPWGDQPETPLSKASADLRNALQNEGTSEQELATKLSALREARKKAQADLEASRKELQEVLTPRQEAVLVMWGMLE